MSEFADKVKSLGVIGRRSGDQVVEGRRSDGVRVKATTDEGGNTVTEHATVDDRVDVTVRPQRHNVKLGRVQNGEE